MLEIPFPAVKKIPFPKNGIEKILAICQYKLLHLQT